MSILLCCCGGGNGVYCLTVSFFSLVHKALIRCVLTRQQFQIQSTLGFLVFTFFFLNLGKNLSRNI